MSPRPPRSPPAVAVNTFPLKHLVRAQEDEESVPTAEGPSPPHGDSLLPSWRANNTWRGPYKRGSPLPRHRDSRGALPSHLASGLKSAARSTSQTFPEPAASRTTTPIVSYVCPDPCSWATTAAQRHLCFCPGHPLCPKSLETMPGRGHVLPQSCARSHHEVT